MRLSINLGFVTNSSSAIHHFPAELLEHPEVKKFLQVFEVSGFVGDLWNRSACGTIALTKEQKQVAQTRFNNDNTDVPHIDVDSTDFVVIYGDEYESLAHTFALLCSDAMAKLKGGDPLDYRFAYQSYN